MRTVTGTCYFPTMNHAKREYSALGLTELDVLLKVNADEIKIGNPPKRQNEVERFVQANRWHIVTVN